MSREQSNINACIAPPEMNSHIQASILGRDAGEGVLAEIEETREGINEPEGVQSSKMGQLALGHACKGGGITEFEVRGRFTLEVFR